MIDGGKPQWLGTQREHRVARLIGGQAAVVELGQDVVQWVGHDEKNFHKFTPSVPSSATLLALVGFGML
jgi:hypothetical protein